ncbi:MAG TPA: hypothetical protein VHO25_19700 [Polyangiaceae bacterium]|nr:hypothetical protein [Polyangiaceae bacterium]
MWLPQRSKQFCKFSCDARSLSGTQLAPGQLRYLANQLSDPVHRKAFFAP